MRTLLFGLLFLSAAARAEPLVPATSVGETTVVRSTELPKTVISSKSARVLGKGRSVEFTGQVTLTRGNDFMSADRLVTEDNNAVARAWGHVFFRRDGPGEPVRWEAWGDRSVYDTAAASGTLWGDNQVAHARRTPLADESIPGGVVDMLAPEIQMTRVDRSTGTEPLAAGIVNGVGGVYLKSVETVPALRVTEIWADHSHFDGPSDRFRLEGAFAPKGAFAPNGAFASNGNPAPNGGGESVGVSVPPPGLDRPYVRQTQGRDVRELRGKIIDLHPSERRLVVQHDVQAHVLFEQKPSQDGKTKMPKEKKSGASAR